MSVSDFDYQASLSGMAQGHAAALDSLFYQEAPAMLALANSTLQRRVTAEELVRESFVLLWKNAAGYDPTLGSARAWIYSIVRFRLGARVRERDRSGASALPAPTLPSITPSARHRFTLAIAQIEPVVQRAIILAYLQSQPYEKLAISLNRPAAQLRAQVQQSLLQLSQTALRAKHRLEPRQQVLIAEYALGLLSQHELAQAHSLMQQSDQAASLALDWELALLELLDFLPSVTPAATSLAHVYRSLDLGVPGRPPVNPSRGPASAPEAPHQAEHAPPTPPVAPATTVPERQEYASSPDLNLAVPETAAPEPVTPPYSSLLREDQSPTDNTPTIELEPRQAAVQPPARKRGFSLKRGRFNTIKLPANVATSASPEQAAMPGAAADELSPPSAKTKPFAFLALTGQIPFWPLSSLLLLLLSIGLGYQWYREARIPNVTVVEMQPLHGAVLQAPGMSSSPAWSVAVDPQGNVLLVPQVHTELQPGQTVQLWTQTPGQGDSRSLGLIDPNRPVTVPAALIGKLQNGQLFEMTLEQEGGSESGQPQGPVLYIGSMVYFGEIPKPVPAQTQPVQRS